MYPTGLNLYYELHLSNCKWIFGDTSSKVGYPLANCKRLKSEENVKRELMAAFCNGVTEVVGTSGNQILVGNW